MKKRIFAALLAVVLTLGVALPALADVYIVQRGDVLWRIARDHGEGATWQELAEYNDLRNPHLIFPGQEIRIPAPAPVDVPIPEPTPEPTPEPVQPGGVITGALHRVVYGDNVAYLFGSLHGEGADWFPLAELVEAAMRRADVFAFETDFLDIDSMIEAIMAAAFLPEGLTMDQLLTPEEMARYIEAIRTFGVAEEDLVDINYENPVFMLIQLTQAFMLAMTEDFGMGADVSVDFYVLYFALTQGLPVLFLEPVEQQVTFLYWPPADVIAHVARSFPTLDELLEQIMEEMEKGISLGELADFYSVNDFDALAGMFAVMLDDADDPLVAHQIEMLYNYRSTYYANQILRLLRETEEPTTFFVTVGLSHIMRSWAGDGQLTDIVEQLYLQGVTAVPLF